MFHFGLLTAVLDGWTVEEAVDAAAEITERSQKMPLVFHARGICPFCKKATRRFVKTAQNELKILHEFHLLY